MTETTWKPYLQHSEMGIKKKEELPESVYAFPKQRKVRNPVDVGQ